MNDIVIVERVKDTRTPFYRPQLPQQESEGVHPGILTLMKQCWAEEPSERPSFVEVAKAIRIINKGRSVSHHSRNIFVRANLNGKYRTTIHFYFAPISAEFLYMQHSFNHVA